MAANQSIFDDGYTYVATNTTDKALAYSIAWNNCQANPSSDNLDFLAGSQTALEEPDLSSDRPTPA